MEYITASKPTDFLQKAFQPRYEAPEQIKAKAKEVSAENNKSAEIAQKDKIAKLQTILADHDISLKFRTDDKTNEMVVELVNSETGEAIRQIPSEVSLKLAAFYSRLQGQLINKEV